MKIYFIGAHGVGKSTLARYVSEQYNFPMITEVARAILSEKELNVDSLRTNINIVDDYQTEIFYRQLTEENKLNDFVSDRSFDTLAYAAQHSRVLHQLMSCPQLNEYIGKLRNNEVKIFFIRPSTATLKQDGVRESITWDGVVQIDAMVKFMLQMWNLKYFQINTDSMQERINFVDSILTS